jgi:hypothetical protein
MNKATFQYTFIINAYKRYCYLRKTIKKQILKILWVVQEHQNVIKTMKVGI